MAKSILITGGAGFIGSHLADDLLKAGYKVRVLDTLLEQVHGKNCQRPTYLHPEVELIKGDIRDPQIVRQALKGIDAVYHFAARVGVGQSMYEISEYTSVNNSGTAVLLEAIAENPIGKLIVASSMSIYGEGFYRSAKGKLYQRVSRQPEALRKGQWELYTDQQEVLDPLPTAESKVPELSSVYALSKYDQERLCMLCGQAYNIPTVAMRFFNVYGTRQALSNPYTGVLAIFAARYLNDKAPVIFEDGLQQRDFVHVQDVARACRLALEKPEADFQAFNIGSGEKINILQVAQTMARILKKEHISPEITGQYRVGDIRHCFADISKAKELLGFEPEVSFEKGVAAMAQWLGEQVAEDHIEAAKQELTNRGLTV